MIKQEWRIGDCILLMQKLPNDYIDLVVTSPPYDNLRDYGGYIFDYKKTVDQLYRIVKEGGVVVWIVNDATIKGNETGSSFKQALYFKDIGFNLHDTMIYEKAQACFGSNNCYLQSFEYMFIFSKGKPSCINFIIDRPNVRSGVESISKKGTAKNGQTSERIKKELMTYGKRKNIWKYGVGGGKTGHPAVFPEKLAEDHILSWSNEGDLVFDPFLGSGTTLKMCKKLNRRGLGFECNPDYKRIIEDRLLNAQN